jgi:hypothetical protein
MIGRGPRRTMQPRSRTRTSARPTTRPALRPGRPLDALADQAPAQHPVQRPGHFLGQVRTAAGHRRTGPAQRPTRLLARRLGQARLGEARLAGTLRRDDRPAVPALDLTQPLDQVHAGAPRAAVHLRHPVHCVLAPRADENLALPPHPPFPRTLPAAGVGLPHTTSIAGHSRLLRSSPVACSPPARRVRTASAQVGEHLRVLGDVTRLGNGVHHFPPDHSGLINDERSPRGHAPVLVKYSVKLCDIAVRPEV